MNEALDKYESFVSENLDKDNMYKIIKFLIKEKCDYIEDILNDYLDLFLFPYEEFIDKYNKINLKLDGKLIEMASHNMNLLELFFSI